MARTAATALRSMQGICTRPQMGSQVRPRWCSMATSAVYSTWSRFCWYSSAGRQQPWNRRCRFLPGSRILPGDGGILLGEIVDDTGGGQTPDDLFIDISNLSSQQVYFLINNILSGNDIGDLVFVLLILFLYIFYLTFYFLFCSLSASICLLISDDEAAYALNGIS